MTALELLTALDIMLGLVLRLLTEVHCRVLRARKGSSFWRKR